jgi:hypothetical protein
MNKKTVVSVLVCIFVLAFAIEVNAVAIFSDDFSVREPHYPGRYISPKWVAVYDQDFTAWYDVATDWLCPPPLPDPCDTSKWFMVLGQWGKSSTSDAGMITKDYCSVSGLTYVGISFQGRLESYGNPIIKVIAKFWDNAVNLTPKGEVTKLVIDPCVPTTRLVWAKYDVIVNVPTGAGVAKFTVLNDSSPTNEGTLHFDDFVVTDVVCMNRPSLDVSGDCKVGLADLAELSSQWLVCGKAVQAECW